jgi:hypothetical protein
MSLRRLMTPIIVITCLSGCGSPAVIGALTTVMPNSILADQKEEAKVGDLTVRLLGISDREMGDAAANYEVNDRAWTADGGPYSGPDLRASGGPNGRYLDPGQFKNDLRFLTFELDSRKNQDVDIYGFVRGSPSVTDGHPEWHGRDTPTRVSISALGPNRYRVPVVVPPSAKSAYNLAIADGPSRLVWRSKTLPASSATQVIAKEKWGTLRLIEPPKSYGIEISKSRIPVMTFQIEDVPEPRTHAYEVRLLDQNGQSLVRSIVTHPESVQLSERMLPQLMKIEVHARPYRYIHFPSVAFAPIAAKWGPTYWGREGEAAITPIANIGQVDGIIRPDVEGNGWTSSEFFAPDGKRWREYPESSNLQPLFSGPNWPKQPLVALIRLDDAVINEGRVVNVAVYTSSGSEAGTGLGARLDSGPIYSIRRKMNQILINRPPGDYVQIALSSSATGWTTAGEASPPSVPLIGYTAEQRQQMSRGVNVGVNPFTVIFRANGSMAFFYATPGKDPSTPENHLEENRAKWTPGNEVRLMARLKSGDTVELNSNGASSAGDRDFTFYLDRDAHVVLDSSPRKIRLTDIGKFVVEQRGFENPRYAVVKLPPN